MPPLCYISWPLMIISSGIGPIFFPCFVPENIHSPAMEVFFGLKFITSITLILPVTFHMGWAGIFPGTAQFKGRCIYIIRIVKGSLLLPTSSRMVLGGSQ